MGVTTCAATGWQHAGPWVMQHCTDNRVEPPCTLRWSRRPCTVRCSGCAGCSARQEIAQRARFHLACQHLEPVCPLRCTCACSDEGGTAALANRPVWSAFYPLPTSAPDKLIRSTPGHTVVVNVSIHSPSFHLVAAPMQTSSAPISSKWCGEHDGWPPARCRITDDGNCRKDLVMLAVASNLRPAVACKPCDDDGPTGVSTVSVLLDAYS
jgi:hypothetical protein